MPLAAIAVILNKVKDLLLLSGDRSDTLAKRTAATEY